jgi:hypothetical protein
MFKDRVSRVGKKGWLTVMSGLALLFGTIMPARAGDYVTKDRAIACYTSLGVSQYWGLVTQGTPTDAELKAIGCFEARKGLPVRPLSGNSGDENGTYRVIISTEDGTQASQYYISGYYISQRDGSKLTTAQWLEIPYTRY